MNGPPDECLCDRTSLFRTGVSQVLLQPPCRLLSRTHSACCFCGLGRGPLTLRPPLAVGSHRFLPSTSLPPWHCLGSLGQPYARALWGNFPSDHAPSPWQPGAACICGGLGWDRPPCFSLLRVADPCLCLTRP